MRWIPWGTVAGVLVASALLASSPSRALGQGYGVSPGYTYSDFGASYMPFGGSSGGYVPYQAGPGGGLGVQPRMAPALTRPSPSGAMAGGMRQDLGSVRSALTPLAPLSAIGRQDASMGMGGLIRRPSSRAGGMGGMTRPAVGSYPFRQPPSLLVPGTPAIGMSM